MHAPAQILEKLDYIEADLLKIISTQNQIISLLTEKSNTTISELEKPKKK